MPTTNLQIIISAIDKTSATLSKIGGNLEKTGAKMKSIGKGMTMGLTLPIMAVGAASIKSAADFEDMAKKVGATANLTEEQVKKLGKGVEKMATDTGQATDGIFAAMQKAVSGSLNLVESQELVAKTTKAAASGFGENEKLVDVVTTAYDLFGESAGSAGAILDTLVRSAQATQVSAQDMADAFSRGAPTASELGISEKELAAMLGVVSERMGDTQRGGRALAMMLREIQKPTGESKDIIEELYGSVDNFQEIVSKDAIGALIGLKEKLEGTNYGIEDVITSSNALDAANLLLSDNCERVSEVLGEVENSAGAVDDAYEKSASNAREMAKAKQKLAAALRPLGTILMEMITPAITKLSEVLKKASEWFAKLDPKMKKVIVVILGLVAAAGPLLMVLGSLTVAVGGLSTASLPITGIILAIIAVIALLVAAGVALYLNWDKIKGYLSDTWEGIKYLAITNFEAIQSKIGEVMDWIEGKIGWLLDKVDRVKGAIGGIGGKVGGIFEKAGGWISSNIPSFQEGGIVPGIGPKLVVAHGGETIGRGFGNINIYVQGGNYLDREAGEKFAEVLGKMLRKELRY